MLGIDDQERDDVSLSVHWLDRLDNDDLIVDCASAFAATLARTLESAGYEPRRIDVGLRHNNPHPVEFNVSGEVPSISAADFASLALITLRTTTRRYGLLGRLEPRLVAAVQPSERAAPATRTTSLGPVYAVDDRPSPSRGRGWPVARIVIGVVMGLVLGVLGLPRIELPRFLPTPAVPQATAVQPAFPTAAAVQPAQPTPAVGGRPRQAPVGPRVLFAERFGAPLPGWPNDPQGNAWFGGGAYRLFARQAGRFVAAGVPLSETVRDAVLSAQFHKVGGPAGGGYGLIVRAQGDSSERDSRGQAGQFLVVEVGDQGDFGIWQREGTRWIDIVPWTYSDAVHQGRESNALTVTTRGSTLRVEVNGETVADLSYTAMPASGGVGIFVGGDLNEVALEWLRVETMDG
jgi:hypothetical protein